jgi:hypothetical protein
LISFNWRGRIKERHGSSFGLDCSAVNLKANGSLPETDDDASSGIVRLYGSWDLLCDYHMGNELSLGNLFDRDGRANFGKIWFGQDFRCALNYAGVDRCVSHAFAIEEGGR